MILPAILVCLILAVPDGDTLRARCDGIDKPISIRITLMDAPEREHKALRIAEQPYGAEAQAALQSLCYGKQAEVRPKAHDMYGRTLAAVSCGGVDVAEAQIRAGLAWAYRPTRKSPLLALQLQARAAGLGLWADPAPVPPWVWRKAGKSAK